eukprot:SAG11_NODE_1059_length_6002_cov_2.976453_3_plen_96_part_00
MQDDVAQGSLGNCYFLAAISACAVGERDILLRDLLVEEGADVGIYGALSLATPSMWWDSTPTYCFKVSQSVSECLRVSQSVSECRTALTLTSNRC